MALDQNAKQIAPLLFVSFVIAFLYIFGTVDMMLKLAYLTSYSCLAPKAYLRFMRNLSGSRSRLILRVAEFLA